MQDWSISNLLSGPSLALWFLLFGLMVAYGALAVSFHGSVQIS